MVTYQAAKSLYNDEINNDLFSWQDVLTKSQRTYMASSGEKALMNVIKEMWHGNGTIGDLSTLDASTRERVVGAIADFLEVKVAVFHD